MIYLSNSIYLALRETSETNRNKPFIGYHSCFRSDLIDASSSLGEITFSSLKNIWSPDTYTHYKSLPFTTGSITFTNSLPSIPMNYFTIHGHNMGDNGGVFSWKYRYTLEYYDGTWHTIVEDKLPTTNNTIIEYFDDVLALSFRLTFDVEIPFGGPDLANTFLKITHVKIGQGLFLQKRDFVGIKPYTMDVQYEGLENISDRGNYLGSYVTSESQNWSIKQRNNTPEHIREKIIPFIKHLHGVGSYMPGPPYTFVAAWRPDDYPDEVLYCWKQIRDKVVPEITGRNGLMEWTASGNGIR